VYNLRAVVRQGYNRFLEGRMIVSRETEFRKEEYAQAGVYLP